MRHALFAHSATSALITVSLAVSLAGSLAAQTWNLIPTAANPGDRRDAAMAFSLATGRCVLFGGDSATGQPGDTWTYDGANWSLALPAGAGTPPARRRHTMVYDFQRARVVMFGGFGAAVLGDTWEFDGAVWTQVVPPASPPARFAHASAYDVLRGVTVVFGGTTSEILPRTRTDTWEWNGVNWTQIVTAHAPSEAEDCAMAYDIGRVRCVLAGGTSFFGAPDQSTWEYDGVDWTDVTSAVGPGPTSTPGLGVMDAQMVHDTIRQCAVLFGGRTPNGTFPTDTWQYDGVRWALVATSGPPSRTRFCMAMDTTRNKAVIHGGVNGAFTVFFHDTWELNAAVPSYSATVPGCAAPSGLVTNSAITLPRLGQTFLVRIGNVPSPFLGLLYLGLSNTTSTFGPLPIDLGAAGAPGCALRVSTDIELFGIGSGGAITFAQPIPSSASLLSLPFFGEAFVLAAGANALGAVSSYTAQGVIGQ